MLARSRALSTLAALALTVSPACDEMDPESEAIDASPRRGGTNGPPTNTWKIGTSSISAVDTLGAELDGVVLVDVEINNGPGLYDSIDPGTLTVDRGTLQAEINGLIFTGAQFEGSRWTFTLDGSVLQAELTAVEDADAAGLHVPDLSRLDPERLVYTFVWLDGIDPVPTCENDAVGGARTVIFGGFVVDHESGDITARANTLYLGCISGAVGKAALWGYAPDSPSRTSIPLPAFETATRMVRADYCGDGVSHTDIGNEVTMKDRWGINDMSFPGFSTEAVWEAGGAAKCIKQVRETGADVSEPFECPDHEIPVCSSDVALQIHWDDHAYGDFWSNIRQTGARRHAENRSAR
ncbi:hypothetical protein SAMN02745121_06578 [Nannocystis exedens]|uniref:ADYC domain-containing protein n=1 Tax=Nannocystis exedens TaxID=54 RepID=A0A1I2FCU5_9BACT|nr:ADYC domain-containing protein [Nannocystis exedens]PCC70503.1 hypothetical protein NAEX_03566 [Nannocystis exedens]SFF03202.1 hypothetical protein SAMN02745121_06578 [Nannocystis exedens]